MHIALFTKNPTLAAELKHALHGAGFGITLIDNFQSLSGVISGQDLLAIDLASVDGKLDAILELADTCGGGVPTLGIVEGTVAAGRINAFRAGLDDGVTEDFPTVEIALRVQALLRRRQTSEQAIVRFADVVLDRVARSVTRAGRSVRLTEREFRTLEYFIRNTGRVISPMELCEQVWKFHFDPESNVVQVFIMRLRKKIDDEFETKLIHTVPRAGYIMEREGERTIPRGRRTTLVPAQAA
jgi:two-component system OmpR family response regulator